MRPAVALLLALAGVAPAAEPAKHAVLVGVNRYPKLPSLEFAVNDAAELGDVLRGLGYKVTLLTDATPTKPTKANIDAALKQVLRAAADGDTVVVGLSGHGLQFGTDRTKAAYFCPTDAVPRADRTDTLVAVSDLYRELGDSRAGVRVLLVDACRNDPTAPPAGRTRGGVDDSVAPPPRGVAALFSCSRGQESLEHPTLKHGVFFHHVIEGLRGKATDADGEVTFTSLAGHVGKRVGKTAARLQPGHVQTPNLRADVEGASPVLAVVRPPAVSTPRLPAPAPTPMAVVRRAVAAAGGADRIARLKAGTARFTGTTPVAGVDVGFTGRLAYELPAKWRLTMTAEVGGRRVQIAQAVDGPRVRNTVDGADQPLTDPLAAEVRANLRMAEVTQLVPLADPARFTLAAGPDAAVAGRPATVVRVAAPGLKGVRLFFDPGTGLLVGHERRALAAGLIGPPAEVTELTTLGDHRRVAGVLIPFQTTVWHDGRRQTVTRIAEAALLEVLGPND